MFDLAERIENDPRTLALFKTEPHRHLGLYKNNPKKLNGIDSFDHIYTRLRYGYLLFKSFWEDETGEIEAAYCEAFEKIDIMSDAWLKLKRRVLKDDAIEKVERGLELTDQFQEISNMDELKFAATELCNLNKPG